MWVRTQNEDALYHVAAVRAVKMISERTYSVIGIRIQRLCDCKGRGRSHGCTSDGRHFLCLPYDKRKLNDTTPSFPVNCMGKDGIVPYWNQNVTIPL